MLILLNYFSVNRYIAHSFVVLFVSKIFYVSKNARSLGVNGIRAREQSQLLNNSFWFLLLVFLQLYVYSKLSRKNALVIRYGSLSKPNLRRTTCDSHVPCKDWTQYTVSSKKLTCGCLYHYANCIRNYSYNVCYRIKTVIVQPFKIFNSNVSVRP